MLCADCGETTTTSDSCERCGESPLLDGRYRLERVIGHGGNGITYLAKRLSDGLDVCIKELAFHRLASLEAEKLFRREAAVLRRLDHPQIPAYVEDLVSGSGRSLGLYMVQTFVDGHDLQHELSQRVYSQPEVLAIADELLMVVDYLHTRSPAVIHRDIKPSNVMRRDSDNALVLVDFGSVRRLNPSDAEGRATNTIAGTYGYMAPEQFRGHADSRSDVYSVGALALALATQSDPADLTGAGMQRHELDWHRVVAPTSQLGRFLSRTLAPDPNDRPRDAGAARRLIAEIRSSRQNIQSARNAAPQPAPALAPPSPPRPATAKQAASIQAVMVHQRSRTHGKRATSSTRPIILGLGVVALLFGLAMAVAYNANSSSSVPSHIAGGVPADAPRICGGTTCQPFNVAFIPGLEFGMTHEQATNALLGRRGAVDEPGRTLTIPRGEPRAKGARGTEGRDRIDTNLLVGATPAACSLYLPAERGLSEIRCSLLLADNYQKARRSTEALLDNRYGFATKESSQMERSMGHQLNKAWANDTATLKLNATDYSSMGSSFNSVLEPTIDVTQSTQAQIDADAAYHQALVDDMQNTHKAKQRAAAERARQAAERARERTSTGN